MAKLLRELALKLRKGQKLTDDEVLLLDAAAGLIDALELAMGEVVKHAVQKDK
jgi:hypothetical protein